jgi:hypothetical protein
VPKRAITEQNDQHVRVGRRRRHALAASGDAGADRLDQVEVRNGVSAGER